MSDGYTNPALKGAAKERDRKRERRANDAALKSGKGLPPGSYVRTPSAGSMPTMERLADQLHPTGRMAGDCHYEPTPPAGRVP